MDLDDVFKAIRARWTASGLNLSFPGGLHTVVGAFNTNPKLTILPRAVLNQIGESVKWWTSQSRADSALFQFSLFSRGGMTAASALAKALVEAYDNFDIEVAEGTLVKMRYGKQAYIPAPEWPNGIEWTVTFTVEIAVASPAA
mgnify:FL=1